MVETEQDLLDVLEVAVVLASEALEFLRQPIFSFPCLCDHKRQVLSELVLGLSQGHDVHRNVFILFLEDFILGDGDALTQFNDLLR